MNLTIRPATKAERRYTYSQISELISRTGCIGYLRGDITGSNHFYSTWFDLCEELKTPDFKAEFDDVINRFRFGPVGEGGKPVPDPLTFFASRSELAKFCWGHPEARMDSEFDEDFGFRADTDSYTYMMRLNTMTGMYKIYCYCYRRDRVDAHLKDAENGIRFVDTSGNVLFTLPDGGEIKVTYPDGDTAVVRCRYINESHAEIGHGPNSIYHLTQFAEAMKKSGAVVEPLLAKEGKVND